MTGNTGSILWKVHSCVIGNVGSILRRVHGCVIGNVGSILQGVHREMMYSASVNWNCQFYR